MSARGWAAFVVCLAGIACLVAAVVNMPPAPPAPYAEDPRAEALFAQAKGDSAVYHLALAMYHLERANLTHLLVPPPPYVAPMEYFDFAVVRDTTEAWRVIWLPGDRPPPSADFWNGFLSWAAMPKDARYDALDWMRANGYLAKGLPEYE